MLSLVFTCHSFSLTAHPNLGILVKKILIWLKTMRTAFYGCLCIEEDNLKSQRYSSTHCIMINTPCYSCSDNIFFPGTAFGWECLTIYHLQAGGRWSKPWKAAKCNYLSVSGLDFFFFFPNHSTFFILSFFNVKIEPEQELSESCTVQWLQFWSWF